MDINIIVAFCTKDFGIGYNGSLPWKYTEDMEHFKTLTQGHIVVMGKNTWLSLPQKPLNNRENIVISSSLKLESEEYKNVKIVSDLQQLFSYLSGNISKNQKVFIIGGVQLYGECIDYVSTIYATHLDIKDKSYKADTFFPTEKLNLFEIENVSKVSDIISFVTYKKSSQKFHQEYQYLQLLKYVVDQEIRPDRTNVGTASIFGPRLSFDISNSLPLITTKFVSWKTVLKELLFFLKGQTDSKILEQQNVNIWKGNTSREFLDNRNLKDYIEGDMGPMYGWIWRHIGAKYTGCSSPYNEKGYDQLAALIKGLKEDPYSRRHLLTTYCPLYTDQGVLAPCHGIVVQFYIENNDTLSCQVYIRSNDMFLGQPYNIASYAMLTYIIAKMIDKNPCRLIISIGDCHIYTNHFQQTLTQIKRKPLPFPLFKVNDTVKNKSFDELELEDFDVLGYISHPTIKAPLAI